MDRWTIGKRIVLGFGLLMTLLVGVAGLGMWSTGKLTGIAAAAEEASANDAHMLGLLADHLKWVHDMDLDLIEAKKFSSELDPTQCRLGKWLTSQREQGDSLDPAVAGRLVAIDGPHRELHESATAIINHSRAGEKQAAVALFQSTTLPALDAVADVLNELRLHFRAASEASSSELHERASSTRIMGAASAGVALLLAVIFGYAIKTQIGRSLRAIGEELRRGSAEIAAASGQVSSSSQSLAQGASEQAASLQETTSSSVEITAMTKRNTENTHSAAGLMERTGQIVETANEALAEMVSSMDGISHSSEKISQIIRVIDEIAFQTNILALNAAVEAARAGESGMGFAIVADEVRTLAQRCGQAAKDSAALIEESVARSKEGGKTLDRVSETFAPVRESAREAKALVDSVNSSSQEQEQGMIRISQALAQVEQVTQQTAAQAEECASASEQLSAQARMAQQLVGRLEELVG